MTLVIRVDENPEPYVPSDVVRCQRCGTDCWISKQTGGETTALGAMLGQLGFMCVCCAGFCVADEHGKPDAPGYPHKASE